MGDRLVATLAPLGDIEDVFDVVVANIARAGIVSLASELVSSVAPGGWLVVSGITPSQCLRWPGLFGRSSRSSVGHPGSGQSLCSAVNELAHRLPLS